MGSNREFIERQPKAESAVPAELSVPQDPRGAKEWLRGARPKDPHQDEVKTVAGLHRAVTGARWNPDTQENTSMDR
jgi:hypothetical protein